MIRWIEREFCLESVYGERLCGGCCQDMKEHWVSMKPELKILALMTAGVAFIICNMDKVISIHPAKPSLM